MNIPNALIEGVTQDIISYLVEDNKISIDGAMKLLYDSSVFEKLADIDTGLYRESSSYVYVLLKDELLNKKFVQNEI